nr:hypothetical protein [Tanacetum cinerariifolium]
MVTVLIHQDTYSVPLMTTPGIDLTTLQSESPTAHAPLPTSTATTTTITTTTTLPPPPPQPQQSIIDLTLLQRIGELEQHMVNLIQDKSALEERSQEPLRGSGEVNESRPFRSTLSRSDQSSYEVSNEIRFTKNSFWISATIATTPTTSSRRVWCSSYIRSIRIFSVASTPVLHLLIPTEVHLSNDEDTGNDHLPKANMRKDWWKPLLKEEKPVTPEPTWTIPSSNVLDLENNWATALVSTYVPPIKNSLHAKTRDMTTFMNWYCQKVNKTILTQADFKGQAYEVVKAFYPNVIHLQFQMKEYHKMITNQINWVNPKGDQVKINVSRPLPLGGPPGHVTIQTQFYFNKDLDHLRYGNKGSMPALSISKIKAARYPDFGLELLVPEQMWIDEVCTYDISTAYGISHWWFNRSKFYNDRHDSLSHRREVKKQMQIFSVVRIKAFSRYGDFENLNLLLLQGHLDHLSGSDKRWDAKGFEFKHDYTIIESPRAIVFPVNNNERKIMRFNEMYKFSDGTLTLVTDIIKRTKSKQNRTKLSMKQKAWKSQKSTKVNPVKVKVKNGAEEELVHQRLRKTLTHVLELSSCIYLDDRAWGEHGGS